MLGEFRTRTGYKHQIRLHASDVLKCPILGDHKYHHGSIGPQPLSLRMMQLLRMQGVKPNESDKGKIRPWQRGLVPLHLFAQSVFIPGLDDGNDVEIVAEPPPYFCETMTNCNLLTNREDVEEREAQDKQRKRFPLYRDTVFVPKGIPQNQPVHETSL